MKWLVRLYPRAWRDRYEEEFLALLEERPLSLKDGLDLLGGALDAQLQSQVRGVVAIRGKFCTLTRWCGGYRISFKYLLLTYLAATLASLLLWFLHGGNGAELKKFIATPLWLLPTIAFATRRSDPVRAKLVAFMSCMVAVILANLLMYGL